MREIGSYDLQSGSCPIGLKPIPCTEATFLGYNFEDHKEMKISKNGNLYETIAGTVGHRGLQELFFEIH